MAEGEETFRPHVVCVPYPAQGHINPMLKLSKLLNANGFHVTFVNTEFNHRRLLRSKGPHSLDGLPTFRFETIPDGLPFSDDDSTQDIPSLCDSTQKNCLAPFRDLLFKLNHTSVSHVPPVTCIVSDCSMSFTLKAARELRIPNVLFWTASVCSFLGNMHFRTLVEKGFVPLKDESYLTNGYLDTVIDWIPGLEGISLKYLPTFLRTTDPEDIMLNFVISELANTRNASAIMINTFDELEHEVLKHLFPVLPPIYTIGPLQLLQDKIEDDGLRSLSSNLWKEQPGCLKWLDSKKPDTVVYINFGSITVMTPDQLVEFAWGLANSEKDFMWVIRPDVVTGEITAIVPQEFVEETKERGFLASWCPQEQVLRHPSIGGFLTHNGWNSTLESICGGVPMICWPFFGDQQTNCWFCCNKWGIGMEIDSNVKRSDVEKLVRELMEGEEGKAMRKKAQEWKRKAEDATTGTTVDGMASSNSNLEKLVKEVLNRPIME